MKNKEIKSVFDCWKEALLVTLPALLLVLGVLLGTWGGLHDLPETSKGGYWHYFGFLWAVLPAAWISFFVYVLFGEMKRKNKT